MNFSIRKTPSTRTSTWWPFATSGRPQTLGLHAYSDIVVASRDTGKTADSDVMRSMHEVKTKDTHTLPQA